MITDQIEHIFLPSDFTEASHVAFAHALKLALTAKVTLDVMHVADEQSVDWTEFPGVRATLEQWKLLPPNSPRNAVTQLGIDVKKVVAHDSDPVRACLGYLERNPADLIVLATHQHQGRMSWLHKDVAEPLARGSHTMTLFIPHGVNGFVSRADGSISLRNILVPIATSPPPGPALLAVNRIVTRFATAGGNVNTLFIGEPTDAPNVTPKSAAAWEWAHLNRSGDIVAGILEAAEETRADLIVMATDGRNGFLDALRGSTTERVLHGCHCPLLAVPVDGQ